MQVASPLCDHAVIQRHAQYPLHGKAAASTNLRISLLLGEQTIWQALCPVDQKGCWQLNMPTPEAGGPYNLEFLQIDGNDKQIVQDILFGDVFLLSGQSNMELPVCRTLDALPTPINEINNSFVREFRLPNLPCFDPDNQDLPAADWKILSPETVLDMSALGYAFQNEYFKAAQVPIGLLICAIGGTPIESWLPLSSVDLKPEELKYYQDHQSAVLRRKEDQAYTQTWENWMENAVKKDLNLSQYPTARLDQLPWQEISFPRMFFDTPFENQPGIYWYRICFSLTAQDLSICQSRPQIRCDLGAMKDSDVVYLNQVKIGETGYQYPPRKYSFPSDILHEGINEMLIRLTVNRTTGGTTEGKYYGLRQGNWALPFPSQVQILQTAKLPFLPENQFWHRLPGTNYYAYIKPLHKHPFAAVLWYQGESNDRNPQDYGKYFSRMIHDFRQELGYEVPFLYVQLTRFDDPARQVAPDAWAIIREAQSQALQIPGTAMVVSLDAGEDNDLHPLDKFTLGHRLALSARALVLGEDLLHQGPLVEEIKQTGINEVRVVFGLCGNGLQATGDLCSAFMGFIDTQWVYPVEVRVGDNSVHIKWAAGKISRLRYQYANSPVHVYLCNSENLLAGPFDLAVPYERTEN